MTKLELARRAYLYTARVLLKVHVDRSFHIEVNIVHEVLMRA